MATPVVTVTSGGLAVTETTSGLPVSEGGQYGTAVTKVTSGGLPVTYTGGSTPPFVVNQANPPDLMFDFTQNALWTKSSSTTSSASAALTVSRGSVGWANNRSGVWSQFASNTPRITDLGLLVEEARSNSLTFSQLFTNANWGLSNATLTAGQISPDGGTNAFLLLDNATNAQHALVNQGTAVTGGATYTFSIFVRMASTNIVTLTVSNNAFANTFSATFDAVAGTFSATGSAGSGVFTSAGSQVYANDWTRIWITGNLAVGDTTALPVVYLDNGNAVVGTGTGFYIWQAQLEQGIFPTSPIVTAGAAATRLADSVNLTSAPAFGSSFSLFAQATPQAPVAYSGFQNFLTASDGTTANNGAFFRAATSGNIDYNNTVASSNTGGPIGASGAQNISFKAAAASAASDQAMSLNGGTIVTTANGSPTGLHAIRFGTDAGGGGWFDGFIAQTAFWATQRVPNAQLVSMTALNSNFFVEDGDSLFATNGSATASTWMTFALPTLDATTTPVNVAISGQYLSSIVDQFAIRVKPFYLASYNKFIVHFMAGTNDIRRGDSVATVYANLQAYVNQIHALGPNTFAVVSSYPLQCDILGNGPQLAALQSLNNLIYTNWNVLQTAGGLGADGIVDYFAQPTVGMNSYSSSAFCSGTWSPDGQHLNDSGKALMGPLQSAIVNGITRGSASPVAGITVGSGLVGYWTLDTIGAFNSFASNIGNTGTPIGSPAVSAGQVQNCFNFTGANYVQIPNSATYDFRTGGYSYAFWINGAAASQPGFGGVISKGEATNDWGLQRDASTTSLVLFHGGTGLDFQAGSFSTVFTSTWNHVAVTYDGTTAILYINGAAFGFTVAIGAPAYNATFKVRIGAARAAGVPAVAKMDNVKLWNRKLSAAEVLLDYNAGVAGKQ